MRLVVGESLFNENCYFFPEKRASGRRPDLFSRDDFSRDDCLKAAGSSVPSGRI